MIKRNNKRRHLLTLSVLLGIVPATAVAGPMCPDFTNRRLAHRLAQNPDPALRAWADRAALTRQGVSVLSGNVRVRQLDRLLMTDELFYDADTDIARSPGPTYFQTPQIGVHGDHAWVNVNTLRGEVDDAQFTMPQSGGRGSADNMQLEGKHQTRLNGATYTTCPPGHTDWLLSASRVDLDQDKDEGTARNVTLRFKGIPFLYSPWLSFPISGNRKSGFLAPTVGISGNAGFDLSVPYYFNLAPNYDDTVTTRLMTSRGVQIGNQFRYLIHSGTGQVETQYLPSDSEFGDDRWLFSYRHAGLLSDRWSVHANYGRVSDDDYFRDLSTNIYSSETDYLTQSLHFAYQAPQWFSFQALAKGYQTLIPGLSGVNKPYARLPQFRLDAESPNDWYGFRLAMSSSFTNFTRDAGVEGTRTDVAPGIKYQYDTGAWYVNGDARYRQTNYQLQHTETSQPESPSRGLPIVSLRSGLRFERAIGDAWTQTLEPEVFYAYIPFRDQTDLPVFDSGEPDFNFIELFEANRFTGADRIGDTNQITTALTTRLIDAHTGVQKLRASIGEIHRFTEPRVTLPPEARSITNPAASPVTRGQSDIVGLLDYRISRHWSTHYDAEWDPYDGEFNRNAFALRYHGSNDSIVNVGYRYRRSFLKQTDISLMWPLGDRWRLFGRWNYSLRYKTTFETMAGIEYKSCCYIVRAAYRRYVTRNDTSSDIDMSSGIYLQLQLRGLTRFGKDVLGLFKSDTLGY